MVKTLCYIHVAGIMDEKQGRRVSERIASTRGHSRHASNQFFKAPQAHHRRTDSCFNQSSPEFLTSYSLSVYQETETKNKKAATTHLRLSHSMWNESVAKGARCRFAHFNTARRTVFSLLKIL